MWTGKIKATTEEKLFANIITYIQVVTHIALWHYVTYFTVAPFDISKLGFSVSFSNHLSDQQNFGGNLCNVQKKKKSSQTFTPPCSVSLYSKQLVGDTNLRTCYETETETKTNLAKKWWHHHFCLVTNN